jgi:hypothetical protein
MPVRQLKMVVLPLLGLPASAMVLMTVFTADAALGWSGVEQPQDKAGPLNESGRHRDADVLGLLLAKGKVIPAKTKFSRITQRRAADNFHLGAVAKAHFQQTAADIDIAADRDHGTGAANA